LTRTSLLGPIARDAGEIAVIEDDHTIVMPPNKFDLKKQALLFTPEGEGYRITRDPVPYEEELGFRLGDFLGIGGSPVEADNAYREVMLSGPSFPFFGGSYGSIFVGTNGYITFRQGDTSGRPSAAAFADQLPRIAPLWADLDARKGGGIFFGELPGRYVITWRGVKQASFKGASTFQVTLYHDGRVAFVYKKVTAKSSLVGISPGRDGQDAQRIDLSKPPEQPVAAAVFESFSADKRLDLPALTRAFYQTHADVFDAIFIWTDFQFDNGLGYAHSFNVRNDIAGIGLKRFDRSMIYGSRSRLATVVTMGDITRDWPADPESHVVGLFSAVAIACHELGHRWLSYVRFDAGRETGEDLLGRDASHWSFFADTRTSSDGVYSSIMEGNCWQENGNGIFRTTQSAANYFSDLDQYLMGLRGADDVDDIIFIEMNDPAQAYLRISSPLSNFMIGGTRRQTSVAQIIEREGPRLPGVDQSPKEFRVAFVMVVEQGQAPASATLETADRYRRSMGRYFWIATDRRGSLNTTLE
jgi:hypothetical protein